jgi:hypothetical protein
MTTAVSRAADGLLEARALALTLYPGPHPVPWP